MDPASEICKALGFEPNTVQSLEIRIDARDMRFEVTAVLGADKEQLQRGIERVMAEYKLVPLNDEGETDG